MIKLTSLLNELIVSDLSSKGGDRKYFVSYKDKLFLLDDGSKLNKVKKHLRKHPALIGKYSAYSPLNMDDVHEFCSGLAEASPDITVGEYFPQNNQIVVWNMQEVQPKTSLVVKKIAKQLNVDKISRYFNTPENDDIEKTYPQSKLVGGIPSIAFHGTNTLALGNILKYGLDPGRGSSKFASQKIYHEEHIFFTAEFLEATHYAENAVRNDKKGWENYPIVIELIIPDKNLITPDYDADISVTTPRYYEKERPVEPDIKTSMKSMGVSRETGKWGYKGRIPANFIKWVYYFNTFEKKWHKSRPDVWRKLLNNYDWEHIAYKLNMVPPG
jgi:hypothetical protein